MKFLSKLLVIIAVLFIFSFYIWGHGMTNWKVPEENKRVNNSLSTDENSISRGKELYKKNALTAMWKPETVKVQWQMN
ncbi:MAG: hypothetical protein A3H37_05415 [Candidatus Schekmanbacteria bacterium RIFCSPLOWO2_02_FULL_38_14]|uniref:Uncharacterized protein n=1 Tax=Candidatus Schekmanbacteria bacterium RIFCSPLOWO2_12_FULL_38_15 TaxID=1817883 RepID=A0A1F7SND8_9BACT|nr:MAG: hypothetical protein A3H37_05415 [Candidatus Schekmanbacteria bacterium RIFCSPLOWO2_02_FULL_38_14]OGL55292.1 MAG: hypothetical protein A3G31_04615 [Candidatus Schekmanbacteria bacterium RIFCSPLOWO2_12_FULL_38_15]